MSKAFDRVWHTGLIHKLKAAGISEKMLPLVIKLSLRQETTCYTSGAASDWTVNTNNHQITEINLHKRLGIFFSNGCSWHDHINYTVVKARGRINIMRTLKFKLDGKTLETIFIAFIRPLLEYGDIIWDNCTQ